MSKLKNFPCLPKKLLILIAASLLQPVLNSDAVEPGIQPPGSAPFKITRQSKVSEGGRKIIFNEVVPPPPAMVRVVPDFNLFQVEEDDSVEAFTPVQLLSVSATVYDEGVTEIRWGTGGDFQYHAFSNIDFEDLASVGSFESEGIACILFMGIGTEKKEARLSQLPTLPDASAFPSDLASYILLSSASQAQPPYDDVALRAMDALHAYYDAHRALLKQKRLEIEAGNLQRKQSLQAAQLRGPQDTVIHFWPIKSQRRSTTSQGAKTGEGSR